LAGGTEQVLVCGLGRLKYLKENDWRLRGIDIGKRVDELGVSEVTVVLGSRQGRASTAEAAGALLEGMHLSLYRFDDFKTQQKAHQQAKLRRVTVAVEKASVPVVKRSLDGLKGLMAGSELTRRLVDLPPNIALPQYMATEARRLRFSV
jgi:leucyl aminopeptidase